MQERRCYPQSIAWDKEARFVRACEARPELRIEFYAEMLNELVKEGKFDYIGLSEVGAETIRRAHKVRIDYPTRSVCVLMQAS